jgi:3-oxoacyl-[acyl-carrier protein] reductase
MDTGLRGSVVLITGGSRGIGAAAARLFAAEGARVVLGYRASREQAEALAATLPDAVAVGGDVAQEGGVDALFAGALERYGRVDVCVANAGIAHDDSIPWPASTWPASSGPWP